jgi:hypothetical protein
MMNKKGEEGGNHTGLIITIVLFVLLLVILLYSFSGKSGEIFNDIRNLLPESWGGVKPGLVEDGAFRYQVMKDKVQYYDGANWRDFFSTFDIKGVKKQGVQIGERVYLKEEVYNAYRNEYYGDTNPKISIDAGNPVYDYFKKRTSADLPTNLANLFGDGKTEMKAQIYSMRTNIDPGVDNSGAYHFVPGEVNLFASPKNADYSGKLTGLYVFTYDGKVIQLIKIDGWFDKLRAYTPWPASKYNELTGDDKTKYAPVLAFVNAWRDSALKQPIEIRYYTYVKDKSGRETLEEFNNPDKYCLEKIDNDLTVRLSNPNNGEMCVA